MRKIIIIAAALGVTLAAYWGYLLLSGSTPQEPPTSHSDHVLTPSQTAESPQQVGNTTIKIAEQSYYVVRDEATKQVRQVFGFERLANPGNQSVRWQVEKPYMIFYESGVQIRLDADQGLFQIERTVSGILPKDAQLEGHVTIRLTPRGDSELAETLLSFDDLMFSSERTEFSTDGPVRMTSSQVELFGQGLVMLFNAEDGQVEYLNILQLESLRLRNLAQGGMLKTSGNTGDSGQHAGMNPVSDAGKDGGAAAAVSSRPSLLYQCVIQDQVKIRYGDQLVVAGADQVSIQNIEIGRRGTKEGSQSSETPPAAEADAAAGSDTAATAAQPPSETPAVPQPTVNDDRRDVVVTCNGGIVFQLMSSERSVSSAIAVEMNGAPLRIEQVDSQSPDKTQSIVNCGLLHYDMATDVLKLFAQEWSGGVLLGGDASAGRIHTAGPVVWDRKAHYATIAGPGTVYLEDGGQGASDAGQIAFSGRMELFFADSPSQDAPLELTAVNLTGGIEADLRGPGTLKTVAETASLAFGGDNTLTSATLDGAVRFENNDGLSPSVATSRTAVFHFDDGQQLARADLSGDVQLDSGSGRLQTDAATIAFAADADGNPEPTRFETGSQATLQTAEAASAQPPAKFEAKHISYDLKTGSGRAGGPVRFVFYQPADPDSGQLTEYWPVDIHSDGDTEFIAGANQQIETVIFNRNVSGVRTQQFAAYTQEDAFHSDKMIVGLGRDAEGKTGIQNITLRDGDVYAESKRTHETLKLAHTRLSCSEIVYDQQTQHLIAAGPGQIELDNSKAEPSASGDSAGVLSGPSYAQLKGFEKIEWTATDQRINAESGSELLELSYIPLVDGKPDKMIRAAAGRVQINLSDDADGRTQLARLDAQDKVFFEEQGKHILEGASLSYDAAANNGWLSITGTDSRPCMANGARVPYIHYNVTTGDLETRLSTIPGAIPLQP